MENWLQSKAWGHCCSGCGNWFHGSVVVAVVADALSWTVAVRANVFEVIVASAVVAVRAVVDTDNDDDDDDDDGDDNASDGHSD